MAALAWAVPPNLGWGTRPLGGRSGDPYPTAAHQTMPLTGPMLQETDAEHPRSESRLGRRILRQLCFHVGDVKAFGLK
eukprot:3968403-Amphidinium_carterae.1